jgi:hypothetical protein
MLSGMGNMNLPTGRKTMGYGGSVGSGAAVSVIIGQNPLEKSGEQDLKKTVELDFVPI